MLAAIRKTRALGFSRRQSERPGVAKVVKPEPAELSRIARAGAGLRRPRVRAQGR